MKLRETRLLSRRSMTLALGATLLTGLAACSGRETISRGYVLDERALAEIKPGTSVDTVLAKLGTPSTVSTVGNKTFYYISQTLKRTVQFIEPSIVDQRVIAIYFNSAFKVERVANYGIQDGQIFDFISRTTPSSGQEHSFLRQILRGAGGSSFNPFGS
ncbi:outer membrane protein assembly factor BamE [Chelatococcus asaccharovorans]|uniref:Beta-barrel assembly machine subunit BamE n=1 Tax=Chelatococcus asaccharovorans TaxID=28210 RepID=A0A2V3U4Y0_9HYPH|nr:Beta-barrel assembly machine subunit BamE [Chelatococcus asaccharovorans]CAH1668540.1 Beta-barrel assembly machine subunit BamE [Chelatococcus asaccharovorans]CAH1680030.1 Beta-barrel assembly machine subunit BamE [Chelatococcus asaccharovorans]